MSNSSFCYQCGLLEMAEEHHPFCSEVCHKGWAENNFENSKLRRKLSVEEMQKRLLEMGKRS